MEIKAPPQQPQYGIETLFLFPHYLNRADYLAKTGKEAPEWDPTKNVKRWVDPDPQTRSRNVSYTRVLARDERNNIIADNNGRPLVEPLTVEKSFAMRVNMPSDTFTATQDTGIPLWEYDCPMRDLLPDEILVFTELGRVPVVRNTKLWAVEVEEQSGAFLPRDRELLHAIARKLGAE